MDSCSLYTLSYNSMLLLWIVLLKLVYLTIGSTSVISYPLWFTSSWQVCGVRYMCVLSIFLVSVITKYPRLIMYMSCPNPRTSHQQGIWFPLLDNRIRNQDPSAGCAHSYWYHWFKVLSASSARKCIYVCTLTSEFIHLCKYFHINTCIYIYELNLSSLWWLKL